MWIKSLEFKKDTVSSKPSLENITYFKALLSENWFISKYFLKDNPPVLTLLLCLCFTTLKYKSLRH